ncbi:YesL family protein [Planomonospora parontospora]|uniref:YesL family protein n=1 Tax=Planomonospora parontospora TaxID=58119 RepID=UPI0016710237|nr:DUF624 domain-containing protein [Planomonospora parontospora]GGL13088.1 hypothetical protein GCM10014719_13780 [Planomonospora parontospora subsp. antibiotica]GII13960.1 hypothetical protein Ppa05_06860 [Planomonospora parontospora subsp. antibiotica]
MTAWPIRLHAACDELLWAARLNLAWIAFTLAGGVVLGVGPATVAAYTLARRHARYESFPLWREFAAVYRREFLRGSLLVLPPIAAAGVLAGNQLYFSALGPGAGPLRTATLAALVALAAVTAYLLPMYVHYDLPPLACLPRASRLVLARPASTVLLLFTLSAVVFAAATLPVLALVLGAGAWIQLNTWLCLRFFEENEAYLHPKGNR